MRGCFTSVILALGILVAGVVGFNSITASSPRATPTVVVRQSSYSQLVQQTTADGAPIIGDPKAKVTIVEYLDFSCPHCLEYLSTIHQIIDKYVRTGKVRLIVRLETFVGGSYSQTAAEAALCTGKQGKFWDMHDALFDLQSKQGATGFVLDTNIKNIAGQLNLNTDQLVQCVANHDTRQDMDNGAKIGQTAGVNGVPSLMYSTDGQTFQWFKVGNAEQKGGGVSLDTIDQVVTQAYK